jgi:N-acetylmuramoyl-L-alanine amidase
LPCFTRIAAEHADPDHLHRFASFIVLKAPDTPSVLFETGYLSNEDDVEFLGSESGRQKVARSVASAIQVHFARRLASQ